MIQFRAIHADRPVVRLHQTVNKTNQAAIEQYFVKNFKRDDRLNAPEPKTD
jgi:hypothetical protein